MISLNTLPFWIACVAAILVVVPIQSVRLRQAVMAAVNLTFLVVLLRRNAVGLLTGVGAAYVLLQLVARPRLRAAAAGLAGIGVFVLFAANKLPAWSAQVAGDGLGRVLALVGYSYVALRMVEVLRAVFDERHPAPGFVSLVNYLLPFHMLAAGPIQSYDDYVRGQAATAEPTASDILNGFERIAAGLFKKFVLAYLLQKAFLTNLDTGGVYFLIELQLTLVWLFLDFSAYSDIAVGVGTLIGVATPENFNKPFASRNVIAFWERWHISLSLFIRRNIFIPLQMLLMRQGTAPLTSAVVAIAISFFLCGLWHGLSGPYLIWGALQAGGLVTTRLYGFALQKRLGTAGLKTYLQNPVFHALGVFLTFELQALAVAAVVRA